MVYSSSISSSWVLITLSKDLDYEISYNSKEEFLF
jgi:hypothetical protein